MADLQAAKRYAQAAFQIASDQGTISQWRTDLDDVAQVLAESQVATLFEDGRIPLRQRLEIVDRALDISPLARNLARLLVQKGRALDARAVSDAFNRLADEAEGIAHARITTAVDLTADQLAEIERQLGDSLGLRIRAVGNVDPAIVGGVIVQVGDRLIDGSVRTRLQRLRRELEGVS